MDRRAATWDDVQRFGTAPPIVAEVPAPELGAGTVIPIRALGALEWDEFNALRETAEASKQYAQVRLYLFRCVAVNPDGTQLVPEGAEIPARFSGAVIDRVASEAIGTLGATGIDDPNA